MHAFICVHGRPHFHGEKLREFIHRPQLGKGCYVWQNRALTLDEHNEVARKVAEENAEYRPYTLLVATAPAAKPTEDPRDKRIIELEAVVAANREEITKLRKSINPPRRPRQ